MKLVEEQGCDKIVAIVAEGDFSATEFESQAVEHSAAQAGTKCAIGGARSTCFLIRL